MARYRCSVVFALPDGKQETVQEVVDAESVEDAVRKAEGKHLVQDRDPTKQEEIKVLQSGHTACKEIEDD